MLKNSTAVCNANLLKITLALYKLLEPWLLMLNSSIYLKVQVLDMRTSTPDLEIRCLAFLSTPLSLGALNQVQNNF